MFPSFRNPDHFSQNIAGHFICILCPKDWDGVPKIFRTAKEAFVHERTEAHRLFVTLERDDPWNRDLAYFQREEDWQPDAPAATGEPLISPEEQKVIEYKKKLEQIPQFVGKWRGELEIFVEKGEMFGADQRGPPKRRSKSRRLAASNPKKLSSAGASSSSPIPSSFKSPGGWPANPTRPPQTLHVSAPFSAIPIHRDPPTIPWQDTPPPRKLSESVNPCLG